MENNIEKHAYLLIVHTDKDLLCSLVSLLDDPRNDIFIIRDSKSNPSLLEGISTKYSKLFIPPKQLIDIQWGRYSIVEAELSLFMYAAENGHYKYYHLLSGQDLPIKSQNYIHDFCNGLPSGTNLVSIHTSQRNEIDIYQKTRLRHIFISKMRDKNSIIRKSFSLIRKTYFLLQDALNLQKKWDGPKVYKGDQWVSLTDEAVRFIISKESEIERLFKSTFCPDELFVPTILMASDKFRDSIYPTTPSQNGCFREINWQNGKLLNLTEKDANRLIQSNSLFARKFTFKESSSLLPVVYRQCDKNDQ